MMHGYLAFKCYRRVMEISIINVWELVNILTMINHINKIYRLFIGNVGIYEVITLMFECQILDDWRVGDKSFNDFS